MFRLAQLAILLLCMFNLTKSINVLDVEKQLLDSLLSPDKYDPSIRPAGVNGTGPLYVRVNTYVRSISNINDFKMEYDAQITFRQSWIDSRLKFAPRERLEYLTLTRPEKLWMPDTFFSNEKSGHFHNIVLPNVLIRIYPDGTVLYSVRISLKLACPMDLINFPMDNQKCSITCASYGYTTDNIILLWKEGHNVQISGELHLTTFTLVGFDTDHCMTRTDTGTYSCLKLDFRFSRNLNYYLTSLYLPSMFLVFLSWLPFWLDQKATGIRLAIWLAVLLAMFIEASKINANTPPVSYTKAMDVWTGMCLLFISCVLIELCLSSNFVLSEEKQRLQYQQEMGEAMNEKNSMSIDDHGKQGAHRYNFAPIRWLNKFPLRSQKIDVASRFLFPASFAFFNLIYWFTYTSQRSSDTFL